MRKYEKYENNEKLLVNFLKQKTFVMKCKHI